MLRKDVLCMLQKDWYPKVPCDKQFHDQVDKQCDRFVGIEGAESSSTKTGRVKKMNLMNCHRKRRR